MHALGVGERIGDGSVEEEAGDITVVGAFVGPHGFGIGTHHGELFDLAMCGDDKYDS
jgi:hypothetical protein